MKDENRADAYDAIYAAMETGNTGRARSLVEEIQEENPYLAANLKASVEIDYGVIL